ncbi:unnamed protein product [Schistocephalus solidus]|uniref:Protein disulfide-isomerase n=1 Tax=Schistocephalus solidus TaxID=70667 RepID=A0A183TP43_SCHSO|nr:unnamed protein product [Schistocephalus solidus]
MFGVWAVFLCAKLVFAADVLSLTNGDFDSKLKENDITLVKFYAPWCGHCKRIAPEFEAAATQLKESQPNVQLAEVDCTTEKDLCERYGVTGYPTLKVFQKADFGTPENYEGGREKDDIVNYMTTLARPASTEFTSLTEMEDLLPLSRPVVTAQLAGDSASTEEFHKCSKGLRRIVTFMHTNKKIIDAAKDMYLHYSFNLSYLHFYRFVFSFGVAGVRDAETSKYMSKLPMVIAYTKIDLDRAPADFRYWHNRLVKAAQESEIKIKFAVSDPSVFYQEVSEFGIEDINVRKTPLVTITNEKGQHFLMEEDFSVESVKQFVKKFSAGLLKPYIKSEPIPTEKDGHVTKAVAKNFDEVVLNPNKDVLIEFYAPWCGHCKQLKPKYDKLAEMLSSEPNVVIAAMDATANTVLPIFPVTGYPTIYWVPRNSKGKPVPYEGERSTEAMLTYVAAHATDELTGYDRSGSPKKSEL